MCSKIEPQKALNYLLVNAQLQEIKISSCTLRLTFNKNFNNTLEFIYLNTDASFEISAFPVASNSNKAITFFEHRASFIGELYKLIGCEINCCNIGKNGELILQTKDIVISFYPDEKDNSKIIWTIYDGDESIYGQHKTTVSLDDSLTIFAYSDHSVWFSQPTINGVASAAE